MPLLKIIYSFIFLCIYSKAVAYEYFALQHFDIINGLPSNEVYQIIQDKEGYIWMATNYGLSRFDGRTFTNYTRKDGLTDDVVFGFYLARDAKLWFYTYRGGLCYYEKGKIIEPAFNEELKALLRALEYPVIVSISEDNEGNLWLGDSHYGLFKVSTHTVEQVCLPLNLEALNSPLVIQTQKVNNSLVFTGGKSSYEPEEILFQPYGTSRIQRIELKHKPALKNHRDQSHRVKIYPLSNNTFIYAFGHNLYKIENGIVVQRKSLGREQYILYSIHADKQGHLWVGTRKGVLCFPFANLHEDPRCFIENWAVSSVWQDHEGGTWFSTLENGIFYLPHLNMESLSLISLDNSQPLRIISNNYGVYVTTSSRKTLIFPAGNFDQMAEWDGASSAYIPLASWKDLIVVRGHTSTQVFKGKSRIPPSQNPFTCFFFRNNDNSSPYLWYYSKKCLQFVSEAGDSLSFTLESPAHQPKAVSALPDFSKIWLGFNIGLFVYENGKTQSLGETHPVFNDRIADLDLLGNGCLLVTTRENGVFKYDYHTRKIQHLDGIPDNNCQRSYIDDKGRLWVASLSGVTRVTQPHSSSPQYHHYSYHDGLLSREVYDITVYNNHIWAISNKGISRWNYDWTPPKIDVPVAITGWEANDQKKPVEGKTELNYKESHVAFTFKAISFREPAHFMYRLRGLHDNWIVSPEPKAIYSALQPGSYSLELRTPGDNKIHSTVAFSIAPPFWQNPWYWSVAVVLIAGTTFYFLSVRYRLLARENKLYKLFVQAEEKALRAQMNPHFLFNAFNSILELLAKHEYNRAQHYMRSFASLMRTVLRLSRSGEIALADEIQMLELYLQIEKLRFGDKLHYEIVLSRDVRAEIVLLPSSMLLQPYVENALKHGIRSRRDNKGLVRITFTKNGDCLVVRIEDNGKGYKSFSANKSSYGMKITHDRIRFIDPTEKYKEHISELNPENPEYPGTLVELYFLYKLKS
ncbi:MAG: hypothetical protein CMI36_05240 [Owenweeksia sp.]|nr:hypothetical protein [Owenweeksia sp.]MBF98376.1 hypothetical protein [Owenweeksia sp.]HBF19928.1 hypothetical protein [Cryomorphaceae bacterium]|tara:strand:- start:3701 stop:6622 length:2922 start_codon:yes stop_codon:yes gene_type:complete